MKYILMTEINDSGNKVFSKKRIGKGFLYIAVDENKKKIEVEKDWVLFNKDNIVNLGVDKNDGIYPIDIEKAEKENKPEEKSTPSYSVKVTVMNYDNRNRVDVYSEGTDKGVYDAKNIVGIKFVSQNGAELETKDFFNSSYKNYFSFFFLSPNKIKRFTYRTGINKVKQELPKLKVCIYSDRGYIANETKEYLLVDMSLLDIQNSTFSIERNENDVHTDITAVMKCRLNVKSEENSTVYLKTPCFFNEANRVEYEIDGNVKSVFSKYLDTVRYGLGRYTDLNEIDGLSKKVKNAVKCFDYINGMWSKWLSELTNTSLKEYYLDLYNSGKLQHLNDIPLYMDDNINKAINSLKKISEGIKR